MEKEHLGSQVSKHKVKKVRKRKRLRLGASLTLSSPLIPLRLSAFPFKSWLQG